MRPPRIRSINNTEHAYAHALFERAQTVAWWALDQQPVEAGVIQFRQVGASSPHGLAFFTPHDLLIGARDAAEMIVSNPAYPPNSRAQAACVLHDVWECAPLDDAFVEMAARLSVGRGVHIHLDSPQSA